MFYVPLSSQPAIDITKLVQKKLGQDVICKQAVECVRIDEGKRFLRYAAIVERSREHGLFIFTSSRIPCLQSSDLSLEVIIAVDSGFRHKADYHLHLRSADKHVLLELPRLDTSTAFLTKIVSLTKDRKQTFQWLEKYRRECQVFDETDSRTSNSSNPFADDVFDPLRHVSQSQGVTQAKTAGSRQTTWYEDSTPIASQPTASNSALQPSHRSASRDSLDKSVNTYEEFTDSMESVQKQLGISWSVEFNSAEKPASSREKFVRQFLIERENEFTNVQYLKVFCGTWNVNGRSPLEPLNKWMVVDNEPPDIYAIGFQELDLSKEAFIFADSPKEAEWQDAVMSYLHPKAKYKKVKSVRLVGVLLIVYIQEKHVPNISYIDSDSVPTGIMGILGNKGGVSIRFTLYSTSLCFVNSHLAAHQDEFERRNSDYRDIMSRTRFKQFEPPLEISEHDIVFWIGDLNYRIDLPIDEVRTCIKKEMYTRLLEEDQLYGLLQASSDVFKGFEEGTPKFDPTYKFDSGTNNYDTSEKNRVPAWCDRILWRGPNVKQHRYNSHPQLRISDHKPVSSLFTVGVRVIDQKLYKKVYEDIMKHLDRLENDYLPQIKLDKTECVFKDVKFIESQSQVVTVVNIGQVPVEFEFINKLDDPTYCKPWLKATPSKHYIQAGSCCEVTVEVYVDKATVAKLNSGEEKLEDILVLHLAGGKDSFITVSGNFLSSTFGSSIEALVQMHGPIREVPVADLLEIEQPGSLNRLDIAQDGGRLYMVPKEIWKLVDFLHRNGLDKEDLFQQPGRNSEIQLIRDCLDTGKPDRIPDNLSVHSVAEALLMFLECLAQPVIPFNLYSQCMASCNNLMLSKQIVSHLPDCHKNTFLYICAFLRELLQHSAKNGLEPKFICIMFGEVMLRPPPLSTPNKGQASVKDRRSRLREEETKKSAFVYHFVSQDLNL
ncbi:unnamed protein product [Candidula unifasciata]|uniref:phosphoinositide 5-phosphatase n=1 Tax=Candidula unifasciata TaxID=100452 RepID=A0A8S3Z8D8_9EUPU|nr:unnamed protein product [Candidula unifasciata]